MRLYYIHIKLNFSFIMTFIFRWEEKERKTNSRHKSMEGMGIIRHDEIRLMI
jgi:hypothetical protein